MKIEIKSLYINVCMYCIFVYESTHNEGQKKSGGGMVEYWTNGGTIKKNRQKYTHIPLLTQDRDIYDGRVKIHMHTYISMQTWTDIKNKFEREQGFVIGVGIMNKIREALTHSNTTSNTCNMCMHKNTLWTHTHTKVNYGLYIHILYTYLHLEGVYIVSIYIQKQHLMEFPTFCLGMLWKGESTWPSKEVVKNTTDSKVALVKVGKTPKASQ